ncbi:hypothetical protein C343_00117 [Cryptococcus neoformans C23]|uniref:Uncharacterized protein n=2 Tax=Cryptococcus neoformans TaxID=5207 RepID=A0A854QMR3_CRYNE|nr:hypothetical protein CNAG_00118 [Cryptococcus neoformans var. grubii H99]AUB21662.1 hypothetical protein CKF44_00118 [Cryptococcus neoformans var. grubii]OWZ37497.1 hypothetical protein C347_00188 [Cryptococcus neoformans var. grubii AD2-60a]OWZ48670.1 hypothetical protein C343_00117 [Cryptococcus neoformans var. grubii C23]OWZ59191.1 hypothetical protein C368_00112 [Cryptococcus neoformans var. grubii 125.91]OWZ59201.1 hypothetical protein C353_00124 [Cryptococcus neoformans var. grubii AD|eukprot:XP_012046542.1 hypothetical protein CNAG_00118 [Cryptococcus neoformans var. grubii H99]
MSLQPQISTHHTSIPSPLPSSPSFNFHLTRMVNTLMIWVGTGLPTDTAGNSVGGAASMGSVEQVDNKLAGDWSVAMPSRGNIPVTATPLFRSGSTDIALPMSQRLAKKFPLNQIHLSLSLPPSLTNQTGQSIDPYASKMMLVMEKKLGKWIEEILSQERT